MDDEDEAFDLEDGLEAYAGGEGLDERPSSRNAGRGAESSRAPANGGRKCGAGRKAGGAKDLFDRTEVQEQTLMGALNMW